jgi:RimJ/RimL family protein N-acetyltransferase
MIAPTYSLRQDADGRPVLETACLRLRVPQAADLSACIRFWGSDRSHLMGGPWTPEKTQVGFEGILRQWAGNGFGLFILTRPGSDEGIGDTGPFFPETHPEPELGWSLWNEADDGQGLAFEAAVAARAWFFATTSHRTAVSHTDPENHRSHRLLARMGAVVDPDAAHPYGDEPTVTFRHHAGAA